MTGADAFFFPSREETEGIVVLEALASRQHLVLRDIPVYYGWVDQSSAELATDIPGFIEALKKSFLVPATKLKLVTRLPRVVA